MNRVLVNCILGWPEYLPDILRSKYLVYWDSIKKNKVIVQMIPENMFIVAVNSIDLSLVKLLYLFVGLVSSRWMLFECDFREKTASFYMKDQHI